MGPYTGIPLGARHLVIHPTSAPDGNTEHTLGDPRTRPSAQGLIYDQDFRYLLTGEQDSRTGEYGAYDITSYEDKGTDKLKFKYQLDKHFILKPNGIQQVDSNSAQIRNVNAIGHRAVIIDWSSIPWEKKSTINCFRKLAIRPNKNTRLIGQVTQSSFVNMMVTVTEQAIDYATHLATEELDKNARHLARDPAGFSRQQLEVKQDEDESADELDGLEYHGSSWTATKSRRGNIPLRVSSSTTSTPATRSGSVPGSSGAGSTPTSGTMSTERSGTTRSLLSRMSYPNKAPNTSASVAPFHRSRSNCSSTRA